MNNTLSYLLGRRIWWVTGVNVWGENAAFEPELILTETDGAAKRVLLGRFVVGGSAQRIRYDELIDCKGNRLPSTLATPRVAPLTRAGVGAVIKGEPTTESFLIAKGSPGTGITTVDLLIMEMGEL